MRSNFRCATPFRLFSTYQPMKPASQSVAAKLSTNLGGGPNQIIEVGQMELTESDPVAEAVLMEVAELEATGISVLQ